MTTREANRDLRAELHYVEEYLKAYKNNPILNGGDLENAYQQLFRVIEKQGYYETMAQ